MFERFTEKAIKVITQAQKEAIELNHGSLCAEHLLIGIVNQHSGIASKFLKAAGVKHELLKEKVKAKLVNIQTTNTPEILPFSEPVKKILTDAWDKSKVLGTIYITPEHLFLSLVEKESILDLLKDYDTDVDRIVSTVMRVSEKKIVNTTHPEGIQKTKLTSPNKYYSIPSIFEEAESINIMNSAVKKMKNANFEALGTEQILESILENQESEPAQILKSEGVDLETFREKLNNLENRNDEYINNECIFTPKSFIAISSAFDIAKEQGAASIGPEHLLLGILKEKSGIGFNLLKDMGLNTNLLYEKIIRPIEKQKTTTMTILRLAKEEARRLGHNIVGTELILLGILGEGSGVGAKVLNKLGITIKDARKEVENIIKYGNEYRESDIAFTPRAKKILEIAWSKAKKFNSPRIESQHLLLAIIKEKECVALKVLEYLGVDSLEIRQGVIEEINKPEKI